MELFQSGLLVHDDIMDRGSHEAGQAFRVRAVRGNGAAPKGIRIPIISASRWAFARETWRTSSPSRFSPTLLGI